jgi:hypothetical protein
MRHALIKTTNTGLMIGFMLLLVLMPRTTDPDLAPPAPIEFVSASVPTKIWVSKITPVEKPHNTVWRVEFSDGKKVVLWPCVYEDSRHCYWQADTMGNGTGRTFLHARQRYFFVNYYAN